MQKPPQGASAAPPSWRAQPTTAARETLSRKKNPNPKKKVVSRKKNPNRGKGNPIEKMCAVKEIL